MTEPLRRFARERSIPILRRDASRGQIIVLFALTLVAIVGAVGLVIDGGSAWAQRRNQQRVADLAALAAARAEANGALRNDIIAAAIDTAEANGILAGEITVNIPPTQGEYATTTRDCSTAEQVPCWIEVVVDRAHANTFSRVMGQDSWQVSTRAVAVGGIANAVDSGVAPIMFNTSAVHLHNDADNPYTFCNPQPAGCPPDVRVPELDNQFDWTSFCLSTSDCNVDSATVMDLIWGENVAETTVTIDYDIGPHNGGEQDTLCQNLAQAYPDLPAPLTVSTVVQNPDNPDNADLKAFWVFMLTDVDCRGLGQEISGYFVEQLWGVGVDSTPLTIDPGAEPAQYGIFVANLVE